MIVDGIDERQYREWEEIVRVLCKTSLIAVEKLNGESIAMSLRLFT